MATLFSSFESYPKAVALAGRYGLWSFLWIPGAVGLIVGLGIFSLVWIYTPVLGDWMIGWYSWDFAASIVRITSRITAALTMITIGLLLYKYIVLIIAFPFMSFVSQKVEKKLYGTIHGYEGGSATAQFIKEMIRGVQITTILLWRELICVFILLLLTLIPGLAFLTAPGLFLSHAYFAGCCNMDYTLERYFNVKDALAFMKQEFWLTLGNGIVFLLILGIPLIGLFFAPVIGTIAAALESLKILREDNLAG